MDAKQAKERGILKLDPRPAKVTIDARSELTPQGSSERAPPSPQPSVDRLSVTWADPSSMASSGVNLFHLPSETPVSNEVKFSPSAGDGSEDEDYSASLSAVLRQRRASVRRSRKGRTRRPSSPFLADESRTRRRSSVFTTSSGDTAISMEDGQPAIVTQEQIFENIHLHKEVLGSVKQQPLGMRRKLKIVHQAKTYIKRHEGQLQERLAQSKSTRDIYARFNILLTTKWQQMKREAANTSNLLIPWELRIKEIESHFGSVVASYFTFLRWLFWVNLVIGFILLVFVIVPEYLTANPSQDGERKLKNEPRNASNLLTLWEFDGVLKFSPIFYGYYSNVERAQYRMPLAYFLTGLVVYIYSFVAILRKMAENSRMSKLSEKEDECIFSWKLFTGWDFMIGNTETAHNRIASVILGFKEALLEEAEKKKDLRNWRIISLRALVNICVIFLLAVSAYAVVTVVTRSDDSSKTRNWWSENETTVVVTVISITFPVFFELLGFLEHYHPRKQLRLQLARIMLLNLLNLYSLIFALFSKIDGMSKDLDLLKPTLSLNATTLSDNALNMSEILTSNLPVSCFEVKVSCAPCNVPLAIPSNIKSNQILHTTQETLFTTTTYLTTNSLPTYTVKSKKTPVMETKEKEVLAVNNRLMPQNLLGDKTDETTTEDSILQAQKELDRLRKMTENLTSTDDTSSEIIDEDYSFEQFSTKTTSSNTDDDSLDNLTFIYNTDVFNTSDSTTVSGTEKNGITSYDSKINDTNITIYTQTVGGLNTESLTDYNLVSDFTDTTTNIMDFTTNDIVTDSAHSNYTTESDSFYTNSDNYITTSTDSKHSGTYETSTDMDYIVSTTGYTHASVLADSSTSTSLEAVTICPNLTFNCTVNCGGKNVTQVFLISNCTIFKKSCYTTQCNVTRSQENTTVIDVVYEDEHKRRMFILSNQTKKKLLKLCWETMFGQELVKLTMMDLVFVLLGTLFMDFFRALFVRYMNRCWCWDLEKKFPEYGDFKIAENILHLINNQGMVWMGMFFSPGLVVLNVSKLMIMMYLRSWAVMTCNVPHEVVFRVSKSNNFYLALLLTMLFLCVLPVGYTIVWVKPSWHCGPFSEYDKIYFILTSNIYKILPKSLNFALEYIASPAIVIPMLVLLILIIYYLTSLTNSLREANNDLKIQLRRERTEERRKMFQLADTRRRVGSSALDNTPFARWKKALPSFPLGKSIDSDDRKTTCDESNETTKTTKKRGGIFAKIVGMALDKKSDVEAVPELDNDVSHSPNNPNNIDDETDTDFHETLPREVLKQKDITVVKNTDHKKKTNVEFKPQLKDELRHSDSLRVKLEDVNDRTEKRAVIEKQDLADPKPPSQAITTEIPKYVSSERKKLNRKQTSESSTQSKQSDSGAAVIPVITISTTESDDEILQSKKRKELRRNDKKNVERESENKQISENSSKISKSSTSELKPLRRQNSVDSMNEQHIPKDKKTEEERKFQHSL